MANYILAKWCNCSLHFFMKEICYAYIKGLEEISIHSTRIEAELCRSKWKKKYKRYFGKPNSKIKTKINYFKLDSTDRLHGNICQTVNRIKNWISVVQISDKFCFIKTSQKLVQNKFIYQLTNCPANIEETFGTEVSIWTIFS